MASYNRATVMGYVGLPPKIRTTQSGSKVANFSVATNAYSTQNGDKFQTTDWHRVACWDKLADVVEKYVTKGTLVLVSGPLRVRSYQDNEGVKRESVEINAFELQLCGAKDGADRQSAPPPAQQDGKRTGDAERLR